MRSTILLAVLLLMAGSAHSHSFFDRWCCQGDRDCKPAPLKSVEWTPQGWLVSTPTIQQTVVPFNDPSIRYVPHEEDQQFYICEYPSRHLRCLYVPEPGG